MPRSVAYPPPANDGRPRSQVKLLGPRSERIRPAIPGHRFAAPVGTDIAVKVIDERGNELPVIRRLGA
jgi:hypothetical protein